LGVTGAPTSESDHSDLSEITPATDAAIGGAGREVPDSELFAVPEPRIPRRPSGAVLLAKKRQAVALELKKLREERKNKRKNKAQHQCRLCKTTCNSHRAYQDHIQSRKHKNKKAELDGKPRCDTCRREFDSSAHYERHIRGKYHLRVVTSLANK
jgi:Zinc-finger of C2H2 type/Zinc-finger double-stranded RNA-binding